MELQDSVLPETIASGDLVEGMRDLLLEFVAEAPDCTVLHAFLRQVIACMELPAEMPETVICAAIRLPDGHIFRGHRHDSCIRTAFEFVCWNRGQDPGEHHWEKVDMCRDQGFITSRNRYVDRDEGMRLQIAAGIRSVAPGGYRGTLFSEDLYV